MKLHPMKSIEKTAHRHTRTIRRIAGGGILTLLMVFGMTQARSAEEANQADPTPGDAETASAASSIQHLKKLRHFMREQEHEVEERRKTLARIVRTKGIIDTGDDTIFDTIDSNQVSRRKIQEAFINLRLEKVMLESQIESILEFTTNDLIAQAGGLDLPGTILQTLYPQYLELELEHDALKASGLDSNDPAIAAIVKRIQGVRRQLEEAVVNLRATLKGRLDVTNRQLARMETMWEESREAAITRGLEAQDYFDVKQELEMHQSVLQQLRLKLIEATLANRMDD